MDLIQLEYFITVVDEKNVTRASELLHISQPALSKAISRLEQEVGSKMFIRTGRQNELNDQGRLFYQWAKNTLEGYDDLIKEISRTQDESVFRITIASSSFNLVAPIMKDFHKIHPEIRLKELRFTAEDFPSILYNPDIDCVLSTQNHTGARIQSRLVARNPLYLAVPLGHSLSSLKSIALHQAANEAFVLPLSRYLSGGLLNDLFKQAGFNPRISAEVESPHILNMVSSGLGLSICSSAALQMPEASSCRFLRLEDDFCYRDTWLLWEEREKPSLAHHSFIEFLTKNNSQASPI